MNARVRNKWINDELLHARLLSLTPLNLQNSFAVIHKTRVPDANQRGRLFESAIESLTEWWSHSFFSVEPVGHIRSKTFDQVQKTITQHYPLGEQAVLSLNMFEDEEENEIVHTSKSMMKHALMRGGSRDMSAQLFTSLCRALGIPARLVVSLQSVPWQAGVGKPKQKSSGKKKHVNGKEKEEVVEDADEEGDDMEEVHISSSIDVKGKGKERDYSFVGEGQRLDGQSIGNSGAGNEKQRAKPVIRLRKQTNKGYVLRSTSNSSPRRERTPDPTTTPPVFWTEVFSRADARWLPVDPIRCIVNKRKMFDPTPSSSSSVRQENRLVYVLAFEEDGYARDVTPRYAREYGAKVAKVQGGSKSRRDWWESVASIVRRPYRLHRDDLEDEELQSHQMTEGMPTSIAGFKDHLFYVLARHLRQNETIHPLVEIGKFRGESVYSRSSVVSLKAAENWMRSGRKIREGCQPMKCVKQRASTVSRRREIEVMLERGREERERMGEPSSVGGEDQMMQGLYAESQTEMYKPEPITDGKIPKNDFGNIDLYVPSMIPAGGAHIPFKGIAKIARKLGFDYAEAVTGFEFKKRRAFPIIEGVVVAAENEAVLLEAYWEAEREAEAKARTKREERVIKRWTRLVHGLRIRQRLQDQYSDKPQTGEQHWLDTQAHGTEGADEDVPQAGGYLTAADDVVQPFHLPKYQHVVATYSANSPASGSALNKDADVIQNTTDANVMPNTLNIWDQENDDEMEEISPPQPQAQVDIRVPMTMRELADAASKHSIDGEELPSSSIFGPTTLNTTSGVVSTNRATSAVPKPRSSARKRAVDESEGSAFGAKRRKENSASAQAPMPTRVLRPRTSRSAAQIQEQMEREQAYRRAITD